MASDDDFASLMEGGGPGELRVLSSGQSVTGPVVHIGTDTVYVDLGTRADGRIPRAELVGRDGKLRVAVGEAITATVVDPDASDGPLLAVALGADASFDRGMLGLALESGTPVRGKFTRALKSGLEVDLGGVRAFCPASQVDRGYTADLTSYVGQEVDVVLLEVDPEGRSIVVSRRRALEQDERARATRALERMAVGDELGGTISSLQKYGAFVDLDGVEGLVHISELSRSRVDRVEDVVSVGERVQVKVLAIEAGDKGPRIRLSMKALQQPAQAPAVSANQVLAAKVVRLLPHGIIVRTSAGEGMVPKRELTLSPGADHRRAFEVDQEIEVVLVGGGGDRMRFSQAQVADVRAGQDFREYRERQASQGSMGSLGALLGNVTRAELPPGPPPAPPAVELAPTSAPAAAKPAPAAAPVAPEPAAPPAVSGRVAAPARGAPPSGASTAADAPEPDADADAAPKQRRRIVRPRGS